MNKSIYEEAIEKISVGFGGWDRAERLEFVKHALKQAQKQEKLLELYIDLANTLEVIDNAYGYEIFEFSEIKYICNKIKEIRKDNKDDL